VVAWVGVLSLGCQSPSETRIIIHAVHLERSNQVSLHARGVSTPLLSGKTELTLPVAPGDLIPITLVVDDQVISRAWFGSGDHHLVLLPASLTVDRGSFAGRTVPVRSLIDKAVPTLLPLAPRIWRENTLSLAVLEGETGSCMEVGRIEESLIGAAIYQLQSTVGDELFELSANTSETCWQKADVVVRPNIDLREALGTTAITAEPCAITSPGDAGCTMKWARSARIDIDPRASEANVLHELFHVLGLNHTCVVRSIMATDFDSHDLHACGLLRHYLGFSEPLRLQREITAFDIAALQILRDTRRTLSGNERHVEWVLLPS
jgi:hypothetical protein